MSEIEIKDLKASVSRVVDEVTAGASYVITKRGRPAAVIVPIDGAEDLVLANTDECVRIRRRARSDYRRGRSVSLEEMD